MTEVKYRVITWDRKDQPNWKEITTFVHTLPVAYFHKVETGSDSWAVLIADKKLLPEEVELLYED